MEYIERYKLKHPNNENEEPLRNLKQVRFYQKLEKMGYYLLLKPVKIYVDEFGNKRRKANCDVEMAFYLTYNKDKFDRVVVLSGDGDFLPVLKHLRNNEGKKVFVLAYGTRTSKEIKRFSGDSFTDIINLKDCVERFYL